MEHERYVLEHDPRHASLIENAKDMIDETRPIAANAGRLTRLAQVLAWESGGQHFDLSWQGTKMSDIALIRNRRKSLGEHCRRRRPILGNEDSLMSCPLEACF